MAAKKKTRKKRTTKRTAGNKVTPMKKTAKRKLVAKKGSRNKKLVKKAPQKKAVVKTKAAAKKTVGKTVRARGRRIPSSDQTVDTATISLERSRARSGGQAGDLQGLSSREVADSESVDELLEEGNAFEAEVVTGVEDAGDADEREVRTHEVPEDDVPDEYLDKEK